MQNIKHFLYKKGFEFYENFDSGLISSIKIGAIFKLVIFPKTAKMLEQLLVFLYSKKHQFKVLGNLSNVLIVRDVEIPIIVTSKMKEEISIKNTLVTVSAGMLVPKFCEIMRKEGLSGIEGLIGIPASVGGAIFNNAGAFGYSISDKLVKIKVFYQGRVFELYKNEIKFSYHFSNLSGFVILEATFLFENKNEYDIIKLSNKFNYLRGKTQPSGLSLGSVFKKVGSNSAGFYIERAGLKGLRVGGIVVSCKHSNFFVNDNNGSASDFLYLMSVAKQEVENQFGVSLVPEIEKIGGFNETFSRPSHTFEI